ncbi:CS1 type fimbrial major subunit [Stenotrophomonas sp. 24(2023)]|uniref:CS1 type fimbrial major subunit n=1 Tax=Stenotrophomonas sp. 24(2023) TaxID=3068324 RepID=UPI0027E1C49B|nr:CS1 type fimbrial major subunit [Stenotrophomonas sp. 24(2023)]WMJ70354.1 CS1 type fimbrial major subunit [Stenotrophomonas sp. 24(2023)]
MNTIITKAALAAALATASLSAHAAQTNITLTAEIDNTLTLLKADGSAIADAVKLAYNPTRGLNPWGERVRIFSNDITSDVQVRLQAPVELIPGSASGPNVPMSVQLGGRLLSTTPVEFTAAELYDGGLPNASVAMDLGIAQTTAATLAAGSYEGMASIVLNVKP